MGAPQEWNLFTIINALFLFGLHGGVSLSQLTALPRALQLFLLLTELFVPLLGNFYPQYVSFLPCMRYYAGNWPVSIWLVKKSAYHKFSRVKSISGTFLDQFWSIHGVKGAKFGQAKLLAWMSMHLQGRLLPKLYPLALPGGADTVDDYQVNLGETFAGYALGYNFGDGYLHGPFLLNEIQKKCQFEQGEVRQIFIDSCPLGGSEYPWWIRDASDAFNHVHKGAGRVDQLLESQPF
eukprot:TRINITY_DN40924_c0_g1_i2.p1 TRINITY_DN40924_c0_g1~~TRINITY_DN40924_c0_g1_i2.p1  ORF type:complete len:236 (+),score=46.86 TRINITY_DN40924_c0_g1_i2:173-880(+)